MRAFGGVIGVVVIAAQACGGDDSSDGKPGSGGTSAGGSGGSGASVTGGGSGGGGSGGSGATGGSSGAGTGASGGSVAGDAGCAPVLPDPPDGGLGCNAKSGAQAPLATCSAQDPCTKWLPVVYNAPITTNTDVPTCKTKGTSHPAFDDGQPLTRPGIDGTARYACHYAPAGSGAFPLLVYFHGSGAGAETVYDATLLRQKAESFVLSADPSKKGYVLLSLQARNLHFPTASPQDGSKFDLYYRDFSTCSTNPDFAVTDAAIDELVATGTVDPKRIYVSGWSNGGRFAKSYAIARHEIPSPGGNRVAAAALYSGADPFNNTTVAQTPSCQLAPYPKSTVPIFIVSGWCDLMPCDEAQATKLSQSGEFAPGSTMSTWFADLSAKVADPNVTWKLIRGAGDPETTCMPLSLCSLLVATAVHTDWPDGIPGPANGTVDHESEMLDFLLKHPL